jgi:hypothetical protein
VRLGWTERVNLPDLGLSQIAAKIDTGARTSALHIVSMRPTAASLLSPVRGARPSEIRDRLLVVLAKGATIEIDVEDWVFVRDTSGRRERRPVVVTTLHIGRMRRTIRLGLTDRGDMRYPLLVGRTALPPGTLVDPNARNLLPSMPDRSRKGSRPAMTSTRKRTSTGRIGGKI